MLLWAWELDSAIDSITGMLLWAWELDSAIAPIPGIFIGAWEPDSATFCIILLWIWELDSFTFCIIVLWTWELDAAILCIIVLLFPTRELTSVGFKILWIVLLLFPTRELTSIGFKILWIVLLLKFTGLGFTGVGFKILGIVLLLKFTGLGFEVLWIVLPLEFIALFTLELIFELIEELLCRPLKPYLFPWISSRNIKEFLELPPRLKMLTWELDPDGTGSTVGLDSTGVGLDSAQGLSGPYSGRHLDSICVSLDSPGESASSKHEKSKVPSTILSFKTRSKYSVFIPGAIACATVILYLTK
uniref:Uncharacterized protein n=1 Tax=Beauveria malawiensis TaxID=371061 RepID=A0A192RZZ2_9HYPO|nr:hypothetical protein [Beauveria malawiensis]AMD61753.1 hypothetical protein [Beauveria malawiensis]